MFLPIRDLPIALYERGFEYYGNKTLTFFHHPATNTQVVMMDAGLDPNSVRLEKRHMDTDVLVSSEVFGRFTTLDEMEAFLNKL